MGFSIPRVLHRNAKPVTIEEFADAVRALCPPKFQQTLWPTNSRRVGMAISGGVDSMALAFLCNSLKSHNPSLMIGDNPCSGFDAFVVDHEIRDGSTDEAARAAAELAKLQHVRPRILTFDWEGVDPRKLKRLETEARTKRYHLLGRACAEARIDHLFVGHHADDAHETLLQRISEGHYGRGLVGMRKVGHIPHCFGMHGVHMSGFLDDKVAREKPALGFTALRTVPPRLDESDDPLAAGEREQENLPADKVMSWESRPKKAGWLTPHGLQFECGGVGIYRPLLEFEKDRLVATCEANGIRWVEDASNNDPTLTPRNALRHMIHNYKLPEALQRPAMLRMARGMKEKCDQEDKEASDLLRSCKFEMQARYGTMKIEVPEVSVLGADLDQKRRVAVSLMRWLIAVLTPNEHLPSVAVMQNAVSWFFPELATDEHPTRDRVRAFDVGHVHFEPITAVARSPVLILQDGSYTRSWLLSRQPHHRDDLQGPKAVDLVYPGPPARDETTGQKPAAVPLSRSDLPLHWGPWRLYDGRFWIRLATRVNGTLRIAPLRFGETNPFLSRIPSRDRRRFPGVLKQYGLGKIKTTLPALYVDGKVNWRKHTPNLRAATDDDGNPVRTLIALPTLEIGAQELWPHHLKFEVRYKMVDEEFKSLEGLGRWRDTDIVREITAGAGPPSSERPIKDLKAKKIRRGRQGW